MSQGGYKLCTLLVGWLEVGPDLLFEMDNLKSVRVLRRSYWSQQLASEFVREQRGFVLLEARWWQFRVAEVLAR